MNSETEAVTKNYIDHKNLTEILEEGLMLLSHEFACHDIFFRRVESRLMDIVNELKQSKNDLKE